MKVLDATFLIDYDNGISETEIYLKAHADDVFVAPAVVLLEFLLGDVHGSAPTALADARIGVEWIDVHSVTNETVMHGARVADQIGPQGPQLAAMDAVVAGTGRESGAPVVSYDSDLTHPETKRVLDVEEYR